MADDFDERQARIDAFFERSGEPQPKLDRVLAYAERGVDAPESLSLREIRQVCQVLVSYHAGREGSAGVDDQAPEGN